LRYSARKLGPHSDTHAASSTARREICCSLIILTKISLLSLYVRGQQRPNEMMHPLKCVRRRRGERNVLFRRDVEDLKPTLPQLRPHVRRFFRRQARIERGGSDPASLEDVDLILHEGDERGDDEGEAFEALLRIIGA
jgi:hypothetical protein